MKTGLVSLVLLAALSLTAFAQLGLPDGAIQRIGKGAIWQIAYSPDGKQIAVASSIGTWLYDAQTGAELALLTGHDRPATSLAFSPDGQTLATGGNWPDRTIRLWDAGSGAHKMTLDVSDFAGETLTFSPDGKTLAGATYDRKVRIWNAATGARILTLEGHTASITSVAFSPDGRTLASGSQDETVRVWDIGAGTQKFKLTAHTNNVTGVAFSPDGRMLASSSTDWTIRLWDAATGDLQKFFGGQRGIIHCLAFNPDGRTLAGGGDDGAIRIWDVRTRALRRTLEGHASLIKSIAFSPDGRTIASGSWDHTLRLWDSNSGDHRQTIDGHTGKIWSMDFSPDGQSLAIGSGSPFPWGEYDHVRILDASTGELRQTLETQRMTWIQSVAYSPAGNEIASGSGSNINLWDAALGAHKQTLKGHKRTVYGVAYSPDGQMLASASDDKTVRLWEAATGALLRTLAGHNDRVNSVAFSPDGSMLASGSDDHTVRLWNASTGAHWRTLRGERDDFKSRDDVKAVAYSPDGRTLASGAGNLIKLWDAETGAHLHTLEPPRTGVGRVNCLAFHPDGRSLFAGHWRDVHVWDMMTGGLKRTLLGHRDWVTGLAFHPDGQTLVSGSEDGTALLWKINPSLNIGATAAVSPAMVQPTAFGAQFTISLAVAETENAAGYQATVQFDPAVLRFVSAADGGFLPDGAYAAPPTVSEDSVTVAATSLDELSGGDGRLATLTFEVVDFKESILLVSELYLVAPDGERYFPRIENEQVVVEATRETGIAGDVNRDGTVNVQDLVFVGSNLGQTGQNDADVNGDGVVDIVDLVKVAGEIGNGGGAAPASSNLPSSISATDVKRWLELSRGLSLTDAALQRGVLMLENLLAAFVPNENALLPNYPNPFNPETWIPYQLADDSDVQITIYNLHGMLVCQLDLGHRQAGFYADKGRAAYWDGRSMSGEPVASGAYFYQIQAGDFSAVRRMVIVK